MQTNIVVALIPITTESQGEVLGVGRKSTSIYWLESWIIIASTKAASDLYVHCDSFNMCPLLGLVGCVPGFS